jgi:hypothetical protein
MERINLALLKTDKFLTEVVAELLDHQGIIYEIIEIKNQELKFPCIVLPKYDEEAFNCACERCVDKENVIIVEREIPLSEVVLALSGFLDKLYLENRLMEPSITKYEVQLANKIKECYFRLDLPLVRKWFWPDFAEACCVITHDIDTLDHQPRMRDIISWARYFFSKYIYGKPFNDNILNITEKERNKGMRSAFFFFSNYKRYDQYLKKIFQYLQNERFEIGLHGSQFSFQNLKLLKEEKEILEKKTNTKIFAIRQHGLNFLIPQTWCYQEKIGFNYDFSFSYNDKLGFRVGICHPYHPVDMINLQRFNIIEFPTAFMDFTPLYANYDLDEVEKILLELDELSRRFNGCLVVNFHNIYFNKKYSPFNKIFDSFLDLVKRNNYWIATPTECGRWWEMRERNRIEIGWKDKKLYGVASSVNTPLIIETPWGTTHKIMVERKNLMWSLII